MNPREIQDNLELAETLLAQWLRFRQFYYKGISPEPITPDDETQFLEATSGIAQNIRKLGQRIDDKKFPFRKEEISSQLKGAISISHFRAMPENDQKVYYREWHKSLVYLSRTVGALKFQNEGYRPVEKLAKGRKRGGKGMPAGVLIAIVVLVLLGGGAALAMFLGLIG